MFPKINPTTTDSWKSLFKRAETEKKTKIVDHFSREKDRLTSLVKELEGQVFDFSKNLLSSETLENLLNLANEVLLKEAIQAMFKGESINETESRAVLHTLLRASSTPFSENEQKLEEVKRTLALQREIVDSVRNGSATSSTGLPIKNVVNIGIGGSDLGPKMVCQALAHLAKGPKVFHVSNLESSDLDQTLKSLDPKETLFIICSKTFTTLETMRNAFSARDWLIGSGVAKSELHAHFIGITTNIPAATEFGIASDKVLGFSDWVGGRYSLWGPIGISIAMSVGNEKFDELLSGAAIVDEHFLNTDFKDNIPVLMGLIGIWYNNFLGFHSEAVLPYDQSLSELVPFLQQCNMESNGKSIDRNGEPVTYATGPIVWGGAGTNGQHAFYQLIHQGTHIIPCDFIAFKDEKTKLGHQQDLNANFLAQTKALMVGKSKEDLEKEGCSNDLLPHKVFEGNRPTNSFVFDEISAKNLGMLIALYEHKIFVQGVIWNIFSFDQWGVELGKVLAKDISHQMKQKKTSENEDPSTKLLFSKLV